MANKPQISTSSSALIAMIADEYCLQVCFAYFKSAADTSSNSPSFLLVDFTHFIPQISECAQSGRNHILHGDDTITRPTHVEKKHTVCDGLVNHRDSEEFEKDKEKGEDRQKNEWEHDDSIGNRKKCLRRDDCAINHFHRGMLEMESDFRDKVKDRLQDPDIDEKFSDCIRSFISRIATTAQIRVLGLGLELYFERFLLRRNAGHYNLAALE